MDISDAKPRVNGAMLAGLSGKKVLLVAQVKEVSGNVATVTASDGAEVRVTLSPELGSALDAPVVEFVAVVRGAGEVEEVARAPLAGAFDMATYNSVVSKMAEASYKPMCV